MLEQELSRQQLDAELTAARSRLVELEALVADQRRDLERMTADHRVFQAIFRTASVGCCQVDLQGRFLRVNDQACALLGYTGDELLKMSIGDVTHAEDHAEDQDCLARALRGEIASFTREKRYLCKDGTILWGWLSATLIRDEAGAPESFVAVLQDITPRKRTVDQLQAQTQQLEETHTALRVLIEHKDEARQKLESSILSNLNQLVRPYLEQVKSGRLDARQRELLAVVEGHLDDIVAPFAGEVSHLVASLTPMELRVANLIKDGRASKEIADILGIAEKTVSFHRGNIRRKLKLTGHKRSLRSFFLAPDA